MGIGMIDKENLTIGGFIITWLVGIFSAGKLYGVISSDIKQTKRDVVEVRTDLVAVKREFVTSEGDQRLMSFAAHDKIQATCQKHIYERYDSLEKRLDGHDIKLDKILDAVQRGRRDGDV